LTVEIGKRKRKEGRAKARVQEIAKIAAEEKKWAKVGFTRMEGDAVRG